MAVLKTYGIQIDEEESIKESGPVKCPRCFEPNDGKNVFCWKCGTVLAREQGISDSTVNQDCRIISGF
jgi:ribosomal protein S27AE